MKDLPILFSGGMVRAILADRKVNTRRIVKLPPSYEAGEVGHADRCGDGWALYCDPGPSILLRCPYGQPGDRLWVRETWRPDCRGNPGESDVRGIHYRADDTYQSRPRDLMLTIEGRMDSRWRPSIHMPRWASRLTLEVTSVDVERLQAITEEGAKAEGCGLRPGGQDTNAATTARVRFENLWTEINGKREGADWASNPWVWVIGFKRVAL